MDAFAQALGAAPAVSGWTKWLATSPDVGAERIRGFLELAFRHVDCHAQKKILRRLASGDGSNIEALVYELLIFEVCRRFGLAPQFEPRIGNQTPDLRLSISGQEYFADVFVTNRPTKTYIRFQGHDGYKDSGEAAKKIADSLVQKASKYRKLGAPLLIFIARIGHNVSLLDVEIALFGSAIAEIKSTGGLKLRCHEDWHAHGLFCPPGPDASHRNVSAVIACDWFASVARTGQRLHCVVYHHWNPLLALAVGSFGQFPDVRFRENSRGRFLPFVAGMPNIVMSTSAEESIWAPYSPDKPW